VIRPLKLVSTRLLDVLLKMAYALYHLKLDKLLTKTLKISENLEGDGKH